MEIMEDIIPFNIQRFSKDHPECDDVLLNFVAADVSSIPPGKVNFFNSEICESGFSGQGKSI